MQVFVVIVIYEFWTGFSTEKWGLSTSYLQDFLGGLAQMKLARGDKKRTAGTRRVSSVGLAGV